MLLVLIASKQGPGEGRSRPRLPNPSDVNPKNRRLLLRNVYYSGMVDTVPAAANGAPVSLRELRRSMDFQNVSKSAFDRAVLRLADEGKVALHRHDFPTGLSIEERSELVSDGTGDLYVGIALRQ